MLKRRRIIENGTMYDADVPAASASNNGKSAVVNAKGEWVFGEGGGSGSGLPEVTAADNGKVLGVVNAEWGAMNAPSDTVVCNFTYDSVNDTYTCDKTITEMITAFSAGKNVIGFVPSPVEGYGTYKVDLVNGYADAVTFSCMFVSDAGMGYIEIAYLTIQGSIVEETDTYFYFYDVYTLNSAPSASLDNGTLTIG